MRELDTSLQQFGEFLLKARLVKEKAAPYWVRWVRRFLTRPASNEPMADQVRRFFAYCSERQGVPEPRIESDAVRDYLTHLAVRRKVSASTQNQAFSALLFLCREVLGLNVEGVANVVRTATAMAGRRGPRANFSANGDARDVVVDDVAGDLAGVSRREPIEEGARQSLATLPIDRLVERRAGTGSHDLMKGQLLSQQANHPAPPLLQDVRRTRWSQSTLSSRMALDYCVLCAPGLACAWRVPRPTIPQWRIP